MNDFSPLKKALNALADILKQPMNEYIRDGVIQRFEFTFELSWKAMQRMLKQQGVVTGSPQQVIRAAHPAALIDDPDAWMAFLRARNLTVHSYDQKVADEVFEAAKQFPAYVEKLLSKLK